MRMLEVEIVLSKLNSSPVFLFRLQLQDVIDREMLREYQHPGSRGASNSGGEGKSSGFVVRGAPWSGQGNLAPDTTSEADFPEFASTVPKTSAPPVQWGPAQKR